MRWKEPPMYAVFPETAIASTELVGMQQSGFGTTAGAAPAEAGSTASALAVRRVTVEAQMRRLHIERLT
jgi:hypothetical protein